MAIFGIGAAYGGRDDVSEEFFNKGLAYVGWGETDSPSLHQLVRHIKVGDIVYIKAHPMNIGLIIKAVGIVTGDEVVHEVEGLGHGVGVPVKWIWKGDVRLGKLGDRYNVRNNTLYEEFNFGVQSRVIDLLLERVGSI